MSQTKAVNLTQAELLALRGAVFQELAECSKKLDIRVSDATAELQAVLHSAMAKLIVAIHDKNGSHEQ